VYPGWGGGGFVFPSGNLYPLSHWEIPGTQIGLCIVLKTFFLLWGSRVLVMRSKGSLDSH
jgi:hypothetical protein